MKNRLLNFIQNKKIDKVKSNENSENAIINKDTGFHITEAYKSLRTNIMFSMAGDEKCKKVVFASAIPGEGKTTSCINTAITFAQTGAKVLIMDADLRRPSIHKCLNIKNIIGVSNVLGGFSSLSEVIIKSENFGFDYITSGHIPPNPAELLASNKMKEMITELSDYYDYIFIDTPPITVVTDATTIAPLATGVMLVLREKYTPHAAVAESIVSLEFAEAKILGFVLNDSGISGYVYRRNYLGKKYSYKYSSKYGYKYGYNYGSTPKNTNNL